MKSTRTVCCVSVLAFLGLVGRGGGAGKWWRGARFPCRAAVGGMYSIDLYVLIQLTLVVLSRLCFFYFVAVVMF